MSRIFEALQHANPELTRPDFGIAQAPEGMSSFLAAVTGDSSLLEGASRFEIPERAAARLVAWTEPNSLGAEKLRVIAARYKRAQQTRSMKKLLVTSAVPGDGKSTISLNMAITFATQGERTLLIDGDLHQPALAALLGVDGENGLANCCKKAGPQQNLLHRAEGLPLWFLPAGTCEEQPIALLQSNEAAALMTQVANCFTRIVIDSPPMVPLADANAWASLSDSILLVVRDGATPRKALAKSLDALDKSKLFAVVMNGVDSAEEEYYRSYYNAAKSNGKK